MQDLEISKRNGESTTLPGADIEALASSLAGSLVTPGSPDYDEVRAIWNAMIDKRPGLIARCANTADVSRSLGFARERDLQVAVRGGGHHIAGNSLCEGGMLIDLSTMKSIEVDPGSRTVKVQPGATLGDLDEATAPHGMIVPVGINSTTGIAGLTLGGGFGWLSRKYGMTIDSLVSAEVVTAGGETVTVSESSHPDLFWGIRGGGGNFGIVTSFTFRAHEFRTEVLSGLIVFPNAEAKTIMKKYREFAAKAPEDLSVWCVLRQAPPLPFLSESVHGTDVLVLALCYGGEPEQGGKLIEPLREFGTVLGEHVGVQPFVDWQKAFDPLLAPGARNYWKSHNFAELSDEAIGVMVDAAAKVPSPQCEVFVAQMGGATSRVAEDATAYRGRDAAFIMNVHARWDEASDDQACVSWARELFGNVAPYATGGVYINFMPEDEGDRVQAAFGENYQRLAALKKKFDPENFLRLNQNIAPAS